MELSEAYAEYLRHISSPKIKYAPLMRPVQPARAFTEAWLTIRRYVGFDFHEVCRGDNFEAVSKLIDMVDSDLRSIGSVRLARWTLA